MYLEFAYSTPRPYLCILLMENQFAQTSAKLSCLYAFFMQNQGFPLILVLFANEVFLPEVALTCALLRGKKWDHQSPY